MEKLKESKKIKIKRNIRIKILLNIIYIIFIKDSNSKTIIDLIINGIGEQKILSNEFIQPNEIYINEEMKNYTEYYNLPKLQNNILMKWNNTLTNLTNMFSNLNNITKIDFSNVILSIININSICKMSKLKSLTLNNFSIESSSCGNTNDMMNMFSGCSSLISLNLNNFSIKRSGGGFNKMENMFSGCSSLISLNLNYFSIISSGGGFNNMTDMFSGCSSLISLNLNNFSIITSGGGNNIMENMFVGCNPNLIFCSKDSRLIQQIQNALNSSINNCSDICFTPNHKIIKEKKLCIDDCKNDIIYKYEDNNICYAKKQELYYPNNGTIELLNNNTMKINDVIEMIKDALKNGDLNERILNKIVKNKEYKW